MLTERICSLTGMVERVFVYPVEALAGVRSGGYREGDSCQADVSSRGLPGMRDEESAVPLILGRVTAAHGAHAGKRKLTRTDANRRKPTQTDAEQTQPRLFAPVTSASPLVRIETSVKCLIMTITRYFCIIHREVTR